MFFFFFFQAEDGIRDKLVTGVQTCALPICSRINPASQKVQALFPAPLVNTPFANFSSFGANTSTNLEYDIKVDRSEEHTSELQSLAYLVCRLLLEKKKNHNQHHASSESQPH